MDLRETARKHALKNASDYGRADAKFVVGKVIGEFPDAKKDMKKTLAEVITVVDGVNAMPKSEIEEELKGFVFAEKKEEEKGIVLEGAVQGGVVTRFLPEPNGWMHLGHAKAALLSHEAAVSYGGNCLLRFDDTNPEKEQLEFVSAIEADLTWLGLSFSSVRFTSDRMGELYAKAEQLIAQGDAYLCACSREQIAAGRESKKACACRGRSVAENSALWKKLFSAKEGETVLRLKGDLSSDNTVMRDPTLFRVLDAPHYRHGKKYRVWPTYDFEVSISDSLDGVTHALRSKEYELRDELYYRIVEKLGMRKPLIYDFSRLNIRGNVLSKRLIKPLIDEKKIQGWDDPRLLTLRSLRRRGILPEAIKSFVLSFGLSKVESNPPIDALLAENRKLLEPVSEHYFFVANPVKLQVKGLDRQVVLRKHPSRELGFRKATVKGEVWIDGVDAAALAEGEVFRLKDLCNVKLLGKGNVLEGALEKDGPVPKKIQWVSCAEAIPAELLVPREPFREDGSFDSKSLEVRKGCCEAACGALERWSVIQFERVGYARLDDAAAKRFILSC